MIHRMMVIAVRFRLTREPDYRTDRRCLWQLR